MDQRIASGTRKPCVCHAADHKLTSNHIPRQFCRPRVLIDMQNVAVKKKIEVTQQREGFVEKLVPLIKPAVENTETYLYSLV